MIIRKPYAFLIKNFKRIHIFLLILSLYVGYKLIDVSRFVNKFMQTSEYSYKDTITNHITLLMRFSVVLIIIGTVAILGLLLYKKKPWKVYLIPLVEYVSVLFVLGMIRGFFYKLGLSGDIQTTDLRMSKDLLMIFTILQIPAIGIYVMRVFGLDIKKFNFNTDKEFFELSEKDREEFEVNVNIDKESFIRTWRKFVRNAKYFYEEHTLICKIVGIILIIFIGYSAFVYIFITNKVYHQGQNYNFSGYTMQVNDVYITDKNFSGEVVSPKSKFVIANITITNHGAARTLKMEKFHIKNGNYDYVTTRKTYAHDFQDLGTTLEDVKEIKRAETLKFIIIYKVNASLRNNRYTFFYQENSGFLRKFRIKVKDISKINDKGVVKLGKDMTFEMNGQEETISFDDYSISSDVDFSYRTCSSEKCIVSKNTYEAPSGYRILTLPFSSEEIEGKKMFDISRDYSKIKYIDSEGEEEVISFKYPFTKTALGKYVYSLVPEDLENAKEISIVYTIRTNRYVYKLK